jgi:hypothetical protein
MHKEEAKKAGRLMALDYLRGFFIAVIIIDHVGKFPSLGTFITGEARLWITAAEGFVMISGFLIGYVRGYKGLKLPFSAIAQKLGRRAFLLYLWTIITALMFALIDWYVDIVPHVPTPPTPFGDWWALFVDTATFQSAAIWTFFLMLYTIYLFLSIGAVYLLRNNQIRLTVILSLIVYLFGFMHEIKWMQWQVIFFLPAIAGFYFPRIMNWWNAHSDTTRNWLRRGIHSLSLVLLTTSVIFIYFPHLLPQTNVEQVNSLFDIETFGPLRVLLSFLWFISLGFFFDKIFSFLQRWTFGILEYFGTHSLTAYIAHGLIICVISAVFSVAGWHQGFILNSVLALAAVLMVYWFIRIPFIAKIIPR